MNANDELKGYTGSEYLYEYLCGLLITDGVKALASQFDCFWFLDIIVSYQNELSGEEFQVWTLGRYENNSAVVICTDGNNRVLKSQEISFTDFKPAVATVWVENSIALLPSEH